MSGCLWGNWHKFTDQQKSKFREFVKYLEDEKMETPKAEIIKFNPDCQGTHIVQAELDELIKKVENLQSIGRSILELVDAANKNNMMISANAFVFKDLEKILNG